MFKKIHRVQSWLFKPLMKSKSYFSPHFRVKSISGRSVMKISVVIPKKIISKRVKRNTLKRKILHYLKVTVDTHSLHHTVIWLAKDISNINDSYWQKEIDDHLNKIGIKKQQ